MPSHQQQQQAQLIGLQLPAPPVSTYLSNSFQICDYFSRGIVFASSDVYGLLPALPRLLHYL